MRMPEFYQHWDARLVERQPALAAFAHVAARLRRCEHWPDLALLQALCDERGIANARGTRLRLVGEATGEAYEQRIHRAGEMHVRAGLWHDLFNVLAWLAYPETKAALNERHCAHFSNSAIEHGCAPSARGPVRDALTVFDENGAIVASSDPGLLDCIRAFEWKELFWVRRRCAVECMRVFTFGHALAEKALTPYVGITAHTILVAVDEAFTRAPCAEQVAEIDRRAAQAVRSDGAFSAPRLLAPLPMLGVPGWCAENAREAFYDKTTYFRPGRTRS
jgi:hypothetical protein